MRAFVRAVWLIGVVACDGGKNPSASPPVPAGSGSAVAAVVVAVDAAPPPIDAEQLESIPPPLSLADVPVEKIVKSSELNTAGFVHHGKKQYGEAIKLYEDALVLDPGNLLARYNLASAHALRDESQIALTLLHQFKRAACRACNGILLHAAKDSDWKALRTDPMFKDLTTGITVEKTNMKKAFKQVIKAVTTGKPDGLEPFVHPRSPIAVSEASYGRGDGHIATLHGWKAFTEWLKPQKLDAPNDDEYTECDAKCCRWGMRGDSSNVIDSVCFAGPGGVLFISSIHFDGGSI